jgi:signal transduction histidine kinase
VQTYQQHPPRRNFALHHPFDYTPVAEVRDEETQLIPALLDGQLAGGKGEWRWDITTDTITWSEQVYRIAGRDPTVALPSLREHSCFYTSESWDRLTSAVLEVFRKGVPYEIELEMIRPDTSTRWVICSGEAVRDTSNSILHLRGTVEDITERKCYETSQNQPERPASASIERRLIEYLINTHEEERAWVAKELMDDIAQNTSLVAVGIQQLVPTLPQSMAAEHVRIEALWQRTSETIEKLYRLAQELRPPALDLIGLPGAIRALCREFSHRSEVHVEYKTNVAADLDRHLALSFFRVCQEALRHVVKHSQAKNVEIKLTTRSNELLLNISDDGVGLVSDTTSCESNLRFLGIKEQLRLVGGELMVSSQPSLGTRLEARAPLPEPTPESERGFGRESEAFEHLA